VYKSVWQRAFATIFNLTSPAFGGATVTSSTFSGSLGAQATAALQIIGCASVDSDMPVVGGMLGNERRFELLRDVELKNLLTRIDATCGSKTKNMRDVKKEKRWLNILGKLNAFLSIQFVLVLQSFEIVPSLSSWQNLCFEVPRFSCTVNFVKKCLNTEFHQSKRSSRQKITE
jgi:hypothetical protein